MGRDDQKSETIEAENVNQRDVLESTDVEDVTEDESEDADGSASPTEGESAE